jgi:hypothetical protein
MQCITLSDIRWCLQNLLKDQVAQRPNTHNLVIWIGIGVGSIDQYKRNIALELLQMIPSNELVNHCAT